MKRLFLLGASPLLAANLSLSPRVPTAAGSLDEAFLQGAATPGARIADQDGLQEEWSIFPGLPLPLALGLSEGPSTSFSQGNAWAGPQTGDTLILERAPGLGGAPWLMLRQATSLPDTPQTRIAFWRGAVGAYRFGLDLERRLTSSVGLRASTQVRAYPSRKWAYREQINSSYISSSRTLADLPTHGITPGLDEMRWELALSTRLPGGALEGGWRWIDATRGWPDPADTLSLPVSGLDNRQEGFLQWKAGGTHLRTEGAFSIAKLTLEQPQWSLDTTVTTATFAGTEAKSRGQVRWHGQGWSLGPDVLTLWQDGTKDATTNWSALVHREGITCRAGDSLGLSLRAQAGLTQGTIDTRTVDALEDWSAQGGWSHRMLAVEAGASRWHRIPLLTESVLGETSTRWLPAPNLGAQRSDLQEASLRVSPWNFVSLDGSVALLAMDNRLAPRNLATSLSPMIATDTGALRLSNQAGTSEGFGWRTGIRLALGGWQLRSEVCRSRLETPSGAVDLSLPQLWTRSILDWQGRVLAGHMLLNARLGVKTTSQSYAWIPLGNGTATRTRLPASTLADLETRFEIGRFGLYWNLQNLGNQKTSPVPGWSALGVRSGFGIHWILAG
ncbi:MAG: hypothetical protein RL318_2239 [Fibrobacterota bacterium]